MEGIGGGGGGDCLDHLRGKHDGAKFLALKNLGKFFPLWTVPVTFGMRFWHGWSTGIGSTLTYCHIRLCAKG